MVEYAQTDEVKDDLYNKYLNKGHTELSLQSQAEAMMSSEYIQSIRAINSSFLFWNGAKSSEKKRFSGKGCCPLLAVIVPLAARNKGVKNYAKAYCNVLLSFGAISSLTAKTEIEFLMKKFEF
uniref:Uncharacterized protein n=1 Tax=Solanum lycopersicum TaxID=4081 RepID=A0A3Q7GV01_SOLLC